MGFIVGNTNQGGTTPPPAPAGFSKFAPAYFRGENFLLALDAATSADIFAEENVGEPSMVAVRLYYENDLTNFFQQIDEANIIFITPSESVSYLYIENAPNAFPNTESIGIRAEVVLVSTINDPFGAPLKRYFHTDFIYLNNGGAVNAGIFDDSFDDTFE